jgi:O-antigen biosynthesis protein WbqV
VSAAASCGVAGAALTAGAAGPAPVAAGIDWDAVAGRRPFALDEAAVRRRVEGRIVLVTGAAGSLGVPLSTALAAAGPARLVLLDHHEGSLFQLREALTADWPGVPLRAALGDVRSARRLDRLFREERPELVFHLAAYKHVPWGEEDPEAFVEANVLGARALLGAATAHGTGQVVYPSTDKAIDPPSLYGATKRVVEAMLESAARSGGPRCAVVRFVNVLGSRGSAPEKFIRQTALGRPLSVTDRAMRRYWITPDHARLLLLHAACLEERDVLVAPDAGDEITVLEIARRLVRLLRPGAGDPDIAVTGARPGERLAEPIVAAHERLEPLPLPGLLAVRGRLPVDARVVSAHVERLAQLLDGDAPAAALRAALLEAVRGIQSVTPG